MCAIIRGIWFVPLCCLLILSCDDGAVAPEEDPGPKNLTGMALIMPDGGTVSAASVDGASIKLTFPPGAVHAPTQITIRPVAPGTGDWTRFSLEPSGIVFFDDVAVDLTLPEAVTPTDPMLYFRGHDDPMLLPTVVSGRTLSTTIRFFGLRGDGTRTVAGVSPALAMPAAQATPGNQMGAGGVNCQQIIAQSQASFNGFLSLGLYGRAIEAAQEIAATLQRNACPGAQAWLDEAASIACDQLGVALQDAASSNTSTFREFTAQVEPMLTWEGIVQALASNCSHSTGYLGAIDSEVTDYLLFFYSRLGGLTANDWATFSDLKEEALTVFDLMAASASLGLADTYDRVRDDAFLPTIDKMRDVGYQMCVSDGWHYPLSRLTSTGFFAARDIVGTTPPRPGSINPAPSQYANFTDNDIYEDMQYCATCVELEALAFSGGSIDTVMAGGDGNPGQKTDRVTIDVPTRGTLKVGGEMGAFSCWEGLEGDSEIIVALNGADVYALRRPTAAREYFQGTPGEIDIAAAAADANITPKGGTTHELTLRRNRTQCDDRLWGQTDYEIFTATLNWQNPTLDVDVTFPDTVQAKSSADVKVRVGVVDQHGQTAYFGNVDVNLNVTGGTAAQSSGKTDGNGYFTTSVTVLNPVALKGTASGVAQGMSITANALSFEGVSAQQTESATVLPCDASDHSIRESGTGNRTVDTSYGHGRSWATAAADVYSYGGARWGDDYVIYPNDASLVGQRGYVFVKLKYRFTSSGYSTSRPGARVGLGPRNGYSSPYFHERAFNTPSSGAETDIESEWEVRLSCTFGRVSAPLDVYADAFAKSGPDGPSTVSAEITWLGITKVTKEDGTTTVGYRLCSGSGTDYKVGQ